jgi:hypothetical protein
LEAMAAAELPQPKKIRHFARSAHSGDFETLEWNIGIAMFLFDDYLIGFLSRMVADAALLVSTARSVHHMLLLCIFLHVYHFQQSPISLAFVSCHVSTKALGNLVIQQDILAAWYDAARKVMLCHI